MMKIASQTSDAKHKILHITKGGGGLDVYINNILQYLSKDGFEQYVICNRDHGTLFDACQRSGIAVFHVDIDREINFRDDIRAARQIRRLIRGIGPNVIHLHSSKAGALVRLACPLRASAIIYTPNACAYLGMQGIKRSTFVGIESLLAPLTGVLLASTPSEMLSLKKDLFLQPRKLDYFFNSLDIIELEKTPNKGDLGNGKKIVCAARLIYQKNPLMLVRVAERVIKEEPEATFHLIGAGLDDFLGNEVRSLILDLKLENSIYIHDWMPKESALEMISQSSIAISTAVFESFGFFVAEAQALGKPVVATAVLGVEDVVADGKTGYLVASNDDAAMAEKLIFLIRNPEVRQRMGEEAHLRARRMFEIRDTIGKLETVYEATALGNRPVGK